MIAWGISIFPSTVGELLGKVNTPGNFLINTYNSIIAGIANSVVNVFWRGKNNGKQILPM